jgi:LysM repeat protein
MSPEQNRRLLLARSRALLHRYLPRTVRLGVVSVLSGAVLTSAFVLPASASAAQRKSYVVRAGDSLAAIASKQGLESWRLIFDANASVKDPNLIYPGERLVIPPKGARLAHRSLPTPQPVQVRQWAPARRGSSQPRRDVTSSASSGSRRSSSVAGGSVWDRLAQCESGGNWGTSTGNGFYGGLQFTLSTWRAAGGGGTPNQASRETQISVAQRVLQRQGWGAWPACSSKLGLR